MRIHLRFYYQKHYVDLSLYKIASLCYNGFCGFGIVLLLGLMAPAWAQPQLVKNINTSQANTLGSTPRNLISINETLFFVAYTSTFGQELWKSDGTGQGTVLVKDINPGPNSSNAQSLTNVNGTLYFLADNGANGRELWKSDGTEQGTILVKDINPGTDGSYPYNLIEVNAILFFVAYNPTYGEELWKSDGTAAGTTLVKDINPGASASALANYYNFTSVNGILFFVASNGLDGYELWKSDGTGQGTVLVKDIQPGASSSEPNYLVNVNGVLFFTANDGSTGHEVWKSDGTQAGTILVKDINQDNFNLPISSLTNVEGNLFFNVNTNLGYELWKSDGTEVGTVLVKGIYPASSSSASVGIVRYLAHSNGTLYFPADNGITGLELWKSDGTGQGTVPVKDIYPGPTTSLPQSLTVVNDMLYFTAVDETHHQELWKTDGTEAGTMLVKDINLGKSYSLAEFLTVLNGILYFTVNDGVQGDELWKTDGTEPGTVLVKDINLASSSFPQGLTVINDSIYFGANDNMHGYELWRSDGTENGTNIVKDINPGAATSQLSHFTPVNGTLYFSADDGIHGQELWKSNGTPTGTTLVKDINKGSLSSYPGITDSPFIHINGILYFVADDGIHGYELWKSDGTEAGTVLVKDINPGPGNFWPNNFINAEGTLYFIVNTFELWKTDGTEQGTVLVKNINPGGNGWSIGKLHYMNGNLYFIADDGIHGQELWKSNGTPTGTTLVKDIHRSKTEHYTDILAQVNNRLYFVADDEIHGYEMWVTDGTEAGTTIFKDINKGTAHSSPANIHVNSNIFYFSAQDGSHGRELWKSDGTVAGTSLVKDINIGAYNSNPSYFVTNDGLVYFAASELLHGTELWQTDGTAAGTILVKDINPDRLTSDPLELISTNGTLYFTADNGIQGRELWSFKVKEQYITFTSIADKLANDTNFTLSATTSSHLPVSFSLISGPASITGNAVSIRGTGQVIIRASQEGDVNHHKAVSVDQTFTINKAPQTINVSAIFDKVFGEAPFALQATSSAGLAVSFDIISGSATISGNMLTFTSPGKITIRALQMGNEIYMAALPIELTFCVLPAKPQITTTGNNNSASLILASSSATGNQWLKDQEEISGATAQTFTITQAGTYSVRVTIDGCRNIEDSDPIVLTAQESVILNKSVQLSPNPATNKIILTYPTLASVKSIKVFNLVGILLEEIISNNAISQTSIDVSKFSPGKYIVIVCTEKRQYTSSFIKL